MAVITLLATIAGAIVAATGIIPPLTRGFHQALDAAVPNQIFDPATLAQLFARDLITANVYYELMTLNGYSTERADEYKKLFANVLSPADVVNIHRRGVIGSGEYIALMSRAGVDPDQILQYEKALEYFPSPSDLVSFAVREVYSPETVAKFGQKEDMPKEFLVEAEKAGLPSDQAENYWAAHWQLPSTYQAFEMYQRRIIDQDTLNMLLKALDIMPFWREQMTKLAYNPLTRVDVRRMYGLGVLDETDVYNSYLDIGYSPANAERMTEFTIKYENNEASGLTRATLVSSYVKGIIDEEQLSAYLSALGYSEAVVAYWIANANYEKAEEELDLIKNDVIDLYRIGELDLAQVESYLYSKNLPTAFVSKIVTEIVNTEGARRKVPSKSDLDKWLVNGVVSEEYYVSRLKLLGYQDTDILNYLTEIALEVETEKRRYLKQETYVRWVVSGILPVDEFVQIFRELDITDDDIARTLEEAGIVNYQLPAAD